MGLDRGRKISYNIKMKINKVFGSLFILLIGLFFSSPVFAGGGPVEFTLDPNQTLNSGEQYIVHARVSADGPYPTYCKNCFIKLALQNPQDSDYIAQNNDVTNDEGRIYAKVISKVPGNRTIYVSELRNSDGVSSIAYSTIVLPYTGESTFLPSPTPTPQPIGLPAKSIHVKVDSQRYVEGSKRYVNLSWNKVDGATKYIVYNRVVKGYDSNYVVETGSLNTELTLNAFLDYYIKVDACNSAGCISSSEVFIAKMQKNDDKVVNTPTPIVTTSPEPTNSNIEELNKKVENLENQLQASQKKQSALELKFNQLANWIKSIFPFFK